MTTPQETAWLDQQKASIAGVIRTHRWAVQHVGAGDDHEPPFDYTIGLFGLGHPELVVVGLEVLEAHALLERVARLVLEGRHLVPGEEVTEPDCGTPILVELLPDPGEVVLGANLFYDRPDEVSVPAYQLTWPHGGGSWPWDDDYPCDPAVCQPRPGTWRT